jgi:hypothetical protein
MKKQVKMLALKVAFAASVASIAGGLFWLQKKSKNKSLLQDLEDEYQKIKKGLE